MFHDGKAASGSLAELSAGLSAGNAAAGRSLPDPRKETAYETKSLSGAGADACPAGAGAVAYAVVSRYSVADYSGAGQMTEELQNSIVDIDETYETPT